MKINKLNRELKSKLGKILVFDKKKIKHLSMQLFLFMRI